MKKTVKKTVEINGFCPVTNCYESIDVTYIKVTALHDSNEYAVVDKVLCPYIEECPDPSKCPVAHQKTYW